MYLCCVALLVLPAAAALAPSHGEGDQGSVIATQHAGVSDSLVNHPCAPDTVNLLLRVLASDLTPPICLPLPSQVTSIQQWSLTMKRSYSDLDQHTGDPPFSFGQGTRGPRQPKLYQQQLEPGTNKIKACMQCGTTRTPQWREGPYGPKTLCNACGVKRVRAMKAAQQGKNATHVPQVATGTSKKKAAAHAAARTVSRSKVVAFTALELGCLCCAATGCSKTHYGRHLAMQFVYVAQRPALECDIIISWFDIFAGVLPNFHKWGGGMD